MYHGYYPPSNTINLVCGCAPQPPNDCSRHRRVLTTISTPQGGVHRVFASRDVRGLPSWAALQRSEAQKLKDRLSSFTRKWSSLIAKGVAVPRVIWID